MRRNTYMSELRKDVYRKKVKIWINLCKFVPSCQKKGMKYLTKYSEEVRFVLILSTLVVLSVWLSRYIPSALFDNVLSPAMVACSITVSLAGAWMVLRHSEGLRARKLWGISILIWGLADAAYLLSWKLMPNPAMNMGAPQLTTGEILIGNVLGWLMMLYPTEALRPGWINLRHAAEQLAPMFALAVLDYLVPVNLQPVISLYPFFLVIMLLTHVRKYRMWCEENFSSLDDIDVRWIIRYLAMVFLTGLVFFIMCFRQGHARGFTQLWLTIYMITYGTEQIIFRRDPWELLRREESKNAPVEEPEKLQPDSAYRKALDEWMVKEKPYLNPDFKLLDLQNVLPMNRTYLSQFIHSEYDCSFYQFVNRYRIDEAKQLKLRHPDMKLSDVALRCGFSSPSVFSRTFTAITGLTPREWAREELE